MYYFIFQQKSLQTSKRNPRVIKHDKATHRNTVFLFSGLVLFRYVIIERADAL